MYIGESWWQGSEGRVQGNKVKTERKPTPAAEIGAQFTYGETSNHRRLYRSRGHLPKGSVFQNGRHRTVNLMKILTHKQDINRHFLDRTVLWIRHRSQFHRTDATHRVAAVPAWIYPGLIS